MSFIAFDFETSGLPNRYTDAKVTSETLSVYDTCRAISLGAARFSDSGTVIGKFHAIIQPNDFTISKGAIEIHKITQEKAMSEGQPFPDVYHDFQKFIGKETKTLVAHNAHFDENVLRSEILHHGLDMSFLNDLIFCCTLQTCKLKYGRSMKLPSLYINIFGENFQNVHNSLSDSIACGEVHHYFVTLDKRNNDGVGGEKNISIDEPPDKFYLKRKRSGVESQKPGTEVSIQLEPPPTLKRKKDDKTVPLSFGSVLHLPNIEPKVPYFKKLDFSLKNKGTEKERGNIEPKVSYSEQFDFFISKST